MIPQVHLEEEKKGSDERDIDEALELTGSCGRFQIGLQAVFMTMILTIGYHNVSNYFIADDPPWTCTDKNSSFCNENMGEIYRSGSDKFNARCILKRNDWTYTTSKKFSIVTEFDLVCEKTSVAALASGVFYLGGFFGCIIGGIAGDVFGRKPVLIVGLTLTFTLSLICCFSVNVWHLTILRAFLGAFQMSSYAIGFVMLSEFIPPSFREASGNTYQLTFCLSQMLIDLTAYYVRTWRNLQLYASFPCLLPLIALFFIPESPRWLLFNKKDDAALDVLRKMSRYNKKSSNFSLKSPNTSVKDYTYFDLLKNRKVLLLTLVQCFVWMTISFVYYAIALQSSNLGGDMYQAFALSALADLPSNFAAIYTCKRFGRKKSVLGGILMAGLLLGTLALVPTTYARRYAVNITISMLAKFAADLSFNSVYIWTFELFPTVLRSQGLSLGVSFERLGAFGAPFLTSVLNNLSYILPYTIMCGLAILCFIFGLILPETNNKPTRETYEDFFEQKDGYQIIE